MAEITKILFRRGLDVVRRTGTGSGITLNASEPGFTLDTKRLYVGDGQTIGAIPVSIRNCGAVPTLFGAYQGYDPTTYSVLTAGGIEVGDIVVDNSSTIMYYVSSKNPESIVPIASADWGAFGFYSQSTAHNGISATKNFNNIDIALDPRAFTVDNSFNVTIQQSLTVDGDFNIGGTFSTDGSFDIGENLYVAGTITCVSNLSTGAVVFSRGGGPGQNSDSWAAAYSNVASLCAQFATLTGAHFVSALSSLPNAVFSHGFPGTPSYIRGVMVCQTANNGYSVGDEMDITGINQTSGNSVPGGTMGANATTVWAAVPNSGTLQALSKTGGSFNITTSNWLLKIYASYP